MSADVLLVPDLSLERWPSMDRYARELASRLDFRVPEEAASLGGPRFLARYVRYPRKLRRYRPRIVHVADHSYAHCLDSFPGIPSVVTVHDAFVAHTLARRDGTPRAWVRDYWLRRVVRALRGATRWIVATEAMREEAARAYALDPERASVIPYGVGEAFFTAPTSPSRSEVRARWGATDADTVVLHVGNCSERKRIPLLLQTVAALRAGGLPARLVQVGGEFDAAQRDEIARLQLAPFVSQQPSVSEPELIASYHAADVLLLPSSYEGFGLPVLEALAAGLPVVAAAVGGVPEAAGGAAVLVSEPASAVEFAGAVDRALKAPERAARRESGLRHARSLSWDSAAAATSGVHSRLAAGHS
ncbi:MAG TPA: glycosyltransferase family 1 protein [Gemmatimonadales bacterium]|nr:glycosyltransferase family 1 protein [Gemmatimonadales bacterium]